LHITQYYFPFVQICEEQNKYTVRWDEQQQVPFACFKDQWVGYDDTRSVTYKVRNMPGNQSIWVLLKGPGENNNTQQTQ
jgi:GH18 family chitinase